MPGYNGEDVEYEYPILTSVNVNWLTKLVGNKVQLLGAYSTESISNIPPKQLLDSEDYYMYNISCSSWFIDSTDGVINDMSLTLQHYGETYQQEDGFSLELEPIEFDDSFYAFFVVEDIYGDTYYSKLMHIGE